MGNDRRETARRGGSGPGEPTRWCLAQPLSPRVKGPAAGQNRSVPQRCHSQTRIKRLQPDAAGTDLALGAIFRSSKRRVGPLSSL